MKDNVFVYAPDVELQARIAQILLDKGYRKSYVTPESIKESGYVDEFPYIGVLNGSVRRTMDLIGDIVKKEITIKEMLELPNMPSNEPKTEHDVFIESIYLTKKQADKIDKKFIQHNSDYTNTSFWFTGTAYVKDDSEEGTDSIVLNLRFDKVKK